MDTNLEYTFRLVLISILDSPLVRVKLPEEFDQRPFNRIQSLESIINQIRVMRIIFL